MCAIYAFYVLTVVEESFETRLSTVVVEILCMLRAVARMEYFDGNLVPAEILVERFVLHLHQIHYITATIQEGVTECTVRES